MAEQPERVSFTRMQREAMLSKRDADERAVAALERIAAALEAMLAAEKPLPVTSSSYDPFKSSSHEEKEKSSHGSKKST